MDPDSVGIPYDRNCFFRQLTSAYLYLLRYCPGFYWSLALSPQIFYLIHSHIKPCPFSANSNASFRDTWIFNCSSMLPGVPCSTDVHNAGMAWETLVLAFQKKMTSSLSTRIPEHRVLSLRVSLVFVSLASPSILLSYKGPILYSVFF